MFARQHASAEQRVSSDNGTRHMLPLAVAGVASAAASAATSAAATAY